MQTQCPHCDTRFRITEAQANLAEGFVRCSVCQEVFNTFVVANQHQHQTSLLEDAATDEADNNLQHVISEPSPDSADTAPQETTEDLTTTRNIDHNQASAANHSADSFDFFDEDANTPLSHVVPEKYRDAYETASIIPNLLWATGILLLTITLSAQYTWFNRNQLNQMPQVQVWLEKICQQFECKDISMRDPARIELISRNIYSHPNEKKALIINVTMKNNADFAQPYPVMQVEFSDVRGGTVAARRFRPAEYLTTPQSDTGQQASNDWPHSLFEPGSNMTFSMEIQDPGKQAMTYEFDFL
jgi:predicted Zn finger-like uncharacterized protein